ncbi:MAG TPA: trypsin-like peptidase domain-containing protein [Planctomycetaceae bacterium]|nr:trypsin-like peptidase domain-containing protein [Planctomycetaceae bacterium]
MMEARGPELDSGRFAAALALWCVLPGLLRADEPPVPESAPERAASVLVRSSGNTLDNGQPRRQVSSGSGTLIGMWRQQYLVLTCHHVLVQGGEHAVQAGSVRFRATVVADDARRDLALLSVRSLEQLSTCPLGRQSPRVQSLVHTGGYPAGGAFRAEQAEVAGFRGEKDLVLRFFNRSGESGGGVFQNGHVVGVVWGHAPASRTTVATTIEHVWQFLREHNVSLEGGSRFLAVHPAAPVDGPRPASRAGWSPPAPRSDLPAPHSRRQWSPAPPLPGLVASSRPAPPRPGIVDRPSTRPRPRSGYGPEPEPSPGPESLD